MSNDIHLRTISQEIPQPSITEEYLNINSLKFHSNAPGANELKNYTIKGTVYWQYNISTSFLNILKKMIAPYTDWNLFLSHQNKSVHKKEAFPSAASQITQTLLWTLIRHRSHTFTLDINLSGSWSVYPTHLFHGQIGLSCSPLLDTIHRTKASRTQKVKDSIFADEMGRRFVLVGRLNHFTDVI